MKDNTLKRSCGCVHALTQENSGTHTRTHMQTMAYHEQTAHTQTLAQSLTHTHIHTNTLTHTHTFIYIITSCVSVPWRITVRS